MFVNRQNQFRHLRRKGTILIITIWVTMILAGLTLVFARSMRVSAYGAAHTVASQQADMILKGGVHFVSSQVIADAGDLTEETADAYEAMQIEDGYFWVIRPDPQDDRTQAYGLVDEAGKLNLNTAGLDMLQRLPGMTTELAASVIDWRDGDDELTEGGAESEYYLLKASPFPCKNAPLESVDEILLIKGGTQEVLFGEDTNLNGVLDDNEDDGDLTEPPDNANGQLDTGIYHYVTVYSRQTNQDGDGNARINVNDPQARSNLQSLLEDAFNEDRAAEILARITGTYENLLAWYFASGMTPQEFAEIADRMTTVEEQTIAGLINVNTAPREVLLCLPGLEEGDVDDLIHGRANARDTQSMAWVVEVLDQEKAVAIGGLITGRSSQYSADIVGVSGNGRAYSRARLILDATASPSMVQYFKFLTYMGWPLERNILTALRSGRTLEYGIDAGF